MERKDLTQGDIAGLIIYLSAPLIFSNIFNVIFEIIDAIFIGKIGATALAGVSISGAILFFLATFGAGLSVGTVALVARYTGAKKYYSANETAVQSFFIAIVFSVILGVTGYIFSPMLLKLLGATDKVLYYGVSYIKILFIGIFTMFFLFLGSAILRGSGDTQTPMKIAIFATILNIVLDWILIFGKFGIKQMEASGAALATVISRGIGGVIIFVLLIKGKHNIHLDLKKIKVNFELMKKIIKIGIPASVQMFIRSTSAIILIKIVSLFGTATIAAYGIGGRVFSLFLLPGFGFADASATMVGQNIGARQFKRAKKSALVTSFFYLGVLIVLSSLTYVFAKNIVMFFNTEKDVVKIGTEYLKFISIGALFMSFGLVLTRSFQGAGDSITPMIVTIFSLYFFQIPLAYILSIKFHLNQTGIWIAQPLAGAIHALTMIILFMQGKWLHKKI